MAKLLALAALVAACFANPEGAEEDQPGVYFFNQVSGESTWVHPPEMGYVSTDEAHKGARYWVVDGESTWEKPKKWDWREGYDSTESKHFYYNPHEEKFAWKKPSCIGWVTVDTATNAEL